MTSHLLLDLHHRRSAALTVLLVGALALAACGDGDGGKHAATTTKGTSTTVAATTTTTAPATTTTAAERTAEAVWPWATSSTRYSDPVEAARGFAVDLIGFTDPVMGEYRAGDANSGEVDVRAKTVTTPSTVLVRRINGTWWVLGAITPDIQLTAPAAGTTVSSPLALAGTSTAFEATVDVRLVADGAAPASTPVDGPHAVLASGFVMGGSMGEMGPFSGSLTFTSPGAGASGTLVLLTLSAEDGRVLVTTAVRVHF